VLEGGADMLDKTILVQDLTADEIDAYSVTTQADPVTTAVRAVVTGSFETETVEAEVVENVETTVVGLAVDFGMVAEAVLREAGRVVVRRVL
jgi:hypothetical protein